MYKKYVEIVKETERSVIATIWTGANYYIDIFSKKDLDNLAEYAGQHHIYMIREYAIGLTHVADMLWLCTTEDFSEELLSETIQALLTAQKENT